MRAKKKKFYKDFKKIFQNLFLMSNRCQVGSGTKIEKMFEDFFPKLQQIK
jgi:cytochrome bd-type quinol oxidase subunit 1